MSSDVSIRGIPLPPGPDQPSRAQQNAKAIALRGQIDSSGGVAGRDAESFISLQDGARFDAVLGHALKNVRAASTRSSGSATSAQGIPLDGDPTANRAATVTTVERELQAAILREVLEPLTSQIATGGLSGGSGSGVYSYFVEEALTRSLAESWPLPSLTKPGETSGPSTTTTVAMSNFAGPPISGPAPSASSVFVDPAQGRTSASPSSLQGMIASAAREHRVSPTLLRAMVEVESGGNPKAVSPKGAQGLLQLMPGTAEELGVKNPFDAKENLHGGANYLRQQLDRFGNVREALAAYNAGPGAVARHGGIPPYSETEQYVERVLELEKRFRIEGDLSARR